MGYWARPATPQRTRAVVVDELAEVTCDLLDEGGVGHVTARAVAARLGVAAASIYSRISSVEDLLDLALDRALAVDPAKAAMLESDSHTELLLTWYGHLQRHPWAVAVIGQRPPRGPAYQRLSERLCVLLDDLPVADPVAVAYALSNFVLGCATTAQAARAEPHTPIDAEMAPTYAALEERNVVTAEQVVRAGIAALTGSEFLVRTGR